MERKIIIGLLGAIIVLALLLQNQCSTKRAVRQDLERTEQEVVRWKDETGRERARVEEVELDYQTYKITQSRLQDSLKQAGIKEKIIYVAGTETVITDTIQTVVRDTVVVGQKALSFDYADEFARVTGLVYTDSISLQYSIKNKLTLVSYTKGFFNRRTYVEAISENPNVQITGMKTLAIRDKKRFGFGPQAGVAYVGGKFQPYIGLGVSWNIIRF